MFTYRKAGSADVEAMHRSRLADPKAGPGDERMGAYFAGLHHPHRALAPRTGYVAETDEGVAGYIAGHLSDRHGCDGEVQYLYVQPALRRRGVGRQLLWQMAAWFVERRAKRICVCLDADSPAALPFYLSTGAAQLSPERPFWYVWEDVWRLASFRPEEPNVDAGELP